ncbi:hypothetical protein [Sinorhizobium sp. GL28]|uniref:hypothetical protein n=1 Tax=Sinorhizobium sp. GL28 TaxID=1358418 RepID=UPI000A6ED01D|nr:hypothetical protein [Sinorhizobium sp. GL28]
MRWSFIGIYRAAAANIANIALAPPGKTVTAFSLGLWITTAMIDRSSAIRKATYWSFKVTWAMPT